MDRAVRRQASRFDHSPEVKGRVSGRVLALAAIVLAHGVVFYLVMNERARPPARGDARQAFTPVESSTGESSGSLAEGQRRRDGTALAVKPESRWRFDPIEILPSVASEYSLVSGVMDEGNQHRMVIKSWSQPEYPREWARAGEEGSVFVDVHLDADGNVTQMNVVRATAPARLVESAQRAVAEWRFSMPAAVTAWAEIELRFNSYRFGYSLVAQGCLRRRRGPLNERQAVKGRFSSC